MFNLLTHAWRWRIAPNGPWLVSVLIGCLIAVEMARAALSIVPGPTENSSSAATAVKPPVRQGNTLDVQGIVAAHLFGVPAQGSGARDPDNAPPTDAKLLLSGTLATADPKHGIAIISDADSHANVYSVGQDVAGALLYSVYVDRVILDRGGSLESLILPRRTAGESRPRPQLRPDQSAADYAPRPPPDAPRTLGDVARLSPSAIGTTRGLRVIGGKDSAAFRTSGLRPGDLVTGINGVSLQDQDQLTAENSFSSIQSGRATVTVIRAGRAQDIDIDMGR